jgi:PAS domain S-box-containing protein
MTADAVIAERNAATDTLSNVSVLPGAHQAFQQREVFYRDLLNALPAAVYTTDADGRITFFNEAAVTFAGRRPVIGEDLWCVTWRLYWPDGTALPHDQCPMAIALKEGRPLRGVEAVAERPDGTRVTFIPYPTPLRNDAGEIVGAVNMLVDISDRKAAEERQSLLAHEVNHRANNLLTVVQATVRMTQGDTVEAFRAALNGRIGALAHAHGLLAKSRWTGVDLQHLVIEELAAYVGGDNPRVWISGSMLPLHAGSAQSMAMIVHELATNAVKYGALSTDAGRVLVEWRRSPEGQLVFRWTEADGPDVGPPNRSGVGSTVISRTASHLKGRVRFDWRPEGLVFELSVPADGLAAPDEIPASS